MTVFKRLVRQFCTALKASSDLPGTAGSVGSLALLVLPGLFAPVMLMPKYSPFLFFIRGQRMPNVLEIARGDELMFICFSFGAAGVVAVLKWDSLFLSSLDFRNLAHLPVSLHQVLAAKLVALALMLGVVFVAVSGPSSILFPLAVSGAGPVNLWRLTFAHIVAGLLSLLFTVCAIAGILAVLKLIWPEAWFLSTSRLLRGMLMTASIVTLLTAPALGDLPGAFPAAWFLSFWSYQVGLTVPNSPNVLWAPLATALSASLGALAYYLTYLRWRSALPGALAPPKRRAWSDRLLALLLRSLRTPLEERACIRFAAQTLWRSDGHWLVLNFWLGLGLAFSLIALFSSANELPAISRSPVLLAIPLCLSFTCAWGLRQLLETAAEPACNWVFCTSPEIPGLGAGKWLLRIVGIPLAVLAAMPFAFAAGPRFAAIHTLYGVCVFLVISDVLCRRYYRIPFSSRTLRQGMNPGQLFAVFAVTFCLCVVLPSAFEVWILRSGIRIIWPIIAATATSVFEARRDTGEREGISFESDEDPEVVSLNLSIRGSVFSSVLRNGRPAGSDPQP